MADLKAMAHDIYATISKHDLEGFLDYVAEDVIEHEPPPVENPLPGRQGVRQWFDILFASFPDIAMSPQDMIAEDDRIACRVRVTGTHRGDFMGIPATGKAVDIELIDILRVENEKIAEHWGVIDNASMMQQLGVMPS